MIPIHSRALRLLVNCVLLATPVLAKPWKSAEMITNQQFKYGAFEARIRGAEGSGMITAFFLYKNGSEWAGAEWEEQDFELFGKNGTLQSQLMTPGDPRVEHVVQHRLPTNVWDRYYTYRMEWTPEALSFYIDGKLVRKETDPVVYAKLLDPARAEAMNLRISLWAGDWEWSGSFDESKVPASVDVNWAQVYSYTPGAGPGGSDFSLLWRDDFNTKDWSRWNFANWTFDYAVNDYAPGGANVANGYLQLKMTHWDEEGTRFTASPIDDGSLNPPSDDPDDPVDPVVPVYEDASRIYSVPGTVDALLPTRYQDVTLANTGAADCGGVGPLDLYHTNEGGCTVGAIDAGEWEEFSLDATDPGSFRPIFRVAAGAEGASFRVVLDGASVGGVYTVPNGGWESFQDLNLPDVSLVRGAHVLRVEHLTAGLNLKAIRFAPASDPLGAETTTPLNPMLLPAKILAKNFSSNLDASEGNEGGQCRDGSADLESTDDDIGDCDLGWTESGEWVEYTVHSQEAATYDLALRVGSGLDGKTVHVEVNGTALSSDIAVPTGSWSTFATIDAGSLSLPAGVSTIRFSFPAGGVNLHWFSLSPVASEVVLPGQVSTLDATPLEAAVRLSWSAAANATNYVVERSLDGGLSYATAATTATTSWTDAGAPQGVATIWRVIAVNAAGSAVPSAIVSAMPLPVILPVAPADLAAVAGDATVTLSWTAASEDDSYAILKSVAGGAFAQVATTVATTWTDAGLANGTMYAYKVAGIRGSSASAPGASVTSTPHGAPPAQATGLVATAGNAQVALSWTAVAKATIYKIYRATTGSAVLVNTTSSTAWTDVGVVNGTSYGYAVVASNGDGDAPISVTVVAKPSAPTVALKAQYHPGTSGTTNGIRPLVRLVNTGAVAIDLSKVTIRYWFTKDGATSQNYWCDWAQIGNSNIVSSFVPVAGRTNADNYLQLGFKVSAGTLAAGAGTGEIQSRFSKGDWQNYDQANDWSYNAAFGSGYADAPRITVYYAGVKVWGTEP